MIVPIAMLVTPYGAQLAHRLNKRQMEMGFAVFLLFGGLGLLLRHSQTKIRI